MGTFVTGLQYLFIYVNVIGLIVSRRNHGVASQVESTKVTHIIRKISKNQTVLYQKESGTFYVSFLEDEAMQKRVRASIHDAILIWSRKLSTVR